MSIKARLSAIEAALEVMEDVGVRVIYLDSYDSEPDPGDDSPWGAVYLPTKAASAEEWYEKVRKRFGYLMDGPPNHSPGL